MVFRWNAYPIVFYIENGRSIDLALLTDLNARFLLVSHILRSVVEQVLYHFDKAWSIPGNDRQVRLNLNHDAALFELPLDDIQCLAHELIKRNIFGQIHHASNARKLKQFVEQALHLIDGFLYASGILFETFHVAGGSVLLEVTEKTIDGNQRRFQIM